MSEDNLLWLRGIAARTSKGSVSEVLDRMISDARAAGRTDSAAIRSVIGTVDLPDEDPDLAQADAYVRSVFSASARKPMLVREKGPRVARRARRG